MAIRGSLALILVVAASACTPLRDDVTTPDGSTDGGPDVIQEAGPQDASSADAFDASDGAEASGADATACAPDAADFYVRASVPCAFPTITAAIAAARQSHSGARTIHVAPGTYDEAHNETFPLDLRGGISLVGGGASRADVLIRGMASIEPWTEGGSLVQKPGEAQARGTMLVGDVQRDTKIANITMASGTVAEDRYYGIICVRGTTIAGAATQPDPNTWVDNVLFQPGFGAGIAAATSSQPKSGCNLRVTSSEFDGVIPDNPSWRGVATDGCADEGTPPETAVRIGDSNSGLGNLFSGLGKGTATTGAVFLEGCTASLVVQNNTFEGGEAGIHFIESNESGHYSIVGNHFHAQTHGGLFFQTGSTVEELSDNEFTACSWAAVYVQWSPAAQILHARRNRFIGNDNGVVLVNGPIAGKFDFGQAGDEGANDFRCNGGAIGTANNGTDLDIRASFGNGGSLTAYGNAWDHNPPTQVTSAPPNGTDVHGVAGQMPDVGKPSQSTLGCPQNRVE